MLPTHAIGIELGLKTSSIAYLNEHGEARTIPNEQGDLETPSVVGFDDGAIIVGTEALRHAVRSPDRVVVHAQRYIGNPTHHWQIDGQNYSPIDISSLILRSLLESARRQLDGEIERAVITVPAQFGEAQRLATAEAGLQAGLSQVDIINEPVAAALCFVLGTEGIWFTELVPSQTVLVFELSESKFDVSLVKYSRDEVRVVFSRGDLHLGSLDWNKVLEVMIARRFLSEFGVDPLLDRGSAQALALETEQTVRSLSVRPKAALTCTAAGQRKTYQVHLEEFERLTVHLVDRAEQITQQLLKDHNVGWVKVDVVLSSGDAIRMPMILSMLKRIAGRTLVTTLAPDQSKAHGAAYYSGMLLSNIAFAQSVLNPMSVTWSTLRREGGKVSDFESNGGLPLNDEWLLVGSRRELAESVDEDSGDEIVFAAYPTESAEESEPPAHAEEAAVAFRSPEQPRPEDQRVENAPMNSTKTSTSEQSPAPQPPSENFFHKFLNLPHEVTRPDYYQLLGLERFTDDPAAIKQAAIERNKQLRGWDCSRFYREADQVLDEVVAAVLVLEDVRRKAEYDRSLGRAAIRGTELAKAAPSVRVEPLIQTPVPVVSAPPPPAPKPRPPAMRRPKPPTVVETPLPPERDGVVTRSRRDRGLWGLDVGTTALRAIRLSPPQGASDTMILSDADIIPHEQHLDRPDVNPKELLAQTLAKFTDRHDLWFDRVAIDCPHDVAFAKWIWLPPVDRQKAIEFIRYEAKQQFPYALEDLIWDHQLFAKSEESGFLLDSQVLLVAAKKDVLLGSTRSFLVADIPVELIQLPTLATVNCLNFEEASLREANFESPEYHGVISVGSSSTWLQLTDGFHQWSRTIPIGGAHFTRAIAKERNLTWPEAENLKCDPKRASDSEVRALLSPAFNDFVSELQRSLSYFTSVNREARIKRLLMLGDGWRVAGLQDYCRRELTQPLVSWGPLNTLIGDDELTLDEDVRNASWFRDRESSFVPAYGLALQLAHPKTSAIQTTLFPPELRPNWLRRTLQYFTR